MMKKKFLQLVIMVILFLLPINKTEAQHSDFENATYNIVFSGLTGGIGSVINKEKDEKFHKAFLNGLWKGAVGGSFKYGGKKIINDFKKTENYTYAWGSKLMYSFGNSIAENAAANRGMFDQFNLIIGFNRVEFHTKDKFKVRYQLMPLSLISTIETATVTKFDIKNTLKTGALIFTTKSEEVINSFSSADFSVGGNTRANTILLLDKGEEFFALLPHEIIHTYQYEDFQNINTFFNKPKEKYIKNKIFKKIDQYIYYDLNSPILNYTDKILFGNKSYANNFFESEARFYTRY